MVELTQAQKWQIAEEAIRSQQEGLERSIGRIYALVKPMPEGEIRDKFFDELSCLDVFATVIKQALDTTK